MKGTCKGPTSFLSIYDLGFTSSREKRKESRKAANFSSVNVSQAATKHGLSRNITVFSAVSKSS